MYLTDITQVVTHEIPAGNVADDHGVLVQLGPPAIRTKLLTRAAREHLDGRSDQDDEEQEAQRRDDQRVDESRRFAHRRDVTVARGREGDGGVVERVDP